MDKKTETPYGHTSAHDTACNHKEVSSKRPSAREKRIHRIGSVTCGVSFILFGILFLLHMITPYMSFWIIFRLWPSIFIMLGIEILIGNYKHAADFVYDKGAVFMLIALMTFAMTMGILNECLLRLPSGYAF